MVLTTSLCSRLENTKNMKDLREKNEVKKSRDLRKPECGASPRTLWSYQETAHHSVFMIYSIDSQLHQFAVSAR